MEYSEITVFTNSENAELVAYFLQEVCMDGVSIYDKRDLLSNYGWDYKSESAEQVYGEEVAVKGYCKKEDTDGVLHFLREKFSSLHNAGSLGITVGEVEENAWVENWKKTFRPIYTKKLAICPEWQQCDGERVLYLDSGVAFGTGQHETTSMCLDIAEELDFQGKKVLDVGCGSGILGLCSLLLGAESARMVDVDAQAADIARHNAEINGLQGKCTVTTGSLTQQVEGVFDVVFANLTADILALLRREISRVVKKGSLLILSGILDVKLQQVLSLYGDGFETLSLREKGEWRALLMRAK